MANFITAYKITSTIEGFYSNDSEDYGKETFKGISRVNFPNWAGWKMIDQFKTIPNFPENMKGNKTLDDLVLKFYKKEFWDINNLDSFKSQALAEEMFDTGVNLGTRKAALFLQIALNVLNNRGRLYSNIKEDGNIGSKTLDALDIYLSRKDESYLFKVMNILQGMHYINISRENEVQEKFMYGWLSRVDFLKN